MIKKDEGKFLKKRAEKFLKEGQRLLKEKVYDLAAFNLEQSAQLFIKYTLFLYLGDYPRTHSLRILLKQLTTIEKLNSRKIKKFLEERIETISNLEDAYLTSRYLPKEFSKNEVKMMEKLVIDLVSLLKPLWEI